MRWDEEEEEHSAEVFGHFFLLFAVSPPQCFLYTASSFLFSSLPPAAATVPWKEGDSHTLERDSTIFSIFSFPATRICAKAVAKNCTRRSPP